MMEETHARLMQQYPNSIAKLDHHFRQPSSESQIINNHCL